GLLVIELTDADHGIDDFVLSGHGISPQITQISQILSSLRSRRARVVHLLKRRIKGAGLYPKASLLFSDATPVHSQSSLSPAHPVSPHCPLAGDQQLWNTGWICGWQDCN